MTAVLAQVGLPEELLGDICVCENRLLRLLIFESSDRECACTRVESMSLQSISNPGDLSSRLMDNSKLRDCIILMGYSAPRL